MSSSAFRRLLEASVWLLAVLTFFAAPAQGAFPGQNGRIAFISGRDEVNGDLYTVNPDGSGIARLTNTPQQEWTPNWSPNGAPQVGDPGTAEHGPVQRPPVRHPLHVALELAAIELRVRHARTAWRTQRPAGM